MCILIIFEFIIFSYSHNSYRMPIRGAMMQFYQIIGMRSITLSFLFSVFLFSASGQEFDGGFGSSGRVPDKWSTPLWHSESAVTAPVRGGILTVFGSSCYGVAPTIELSSVLPFDYFVPNVSVKKMWHRGDNFVVATRHSLMSATPGLRWANSNNHERIAIDRAPLIISMTNELMVSRPFIDKTSCAGLRPWLILTGGVAFAFGVPFDEYNDIEMNSQFLANRGESLSGRGFYGVVKARADWQMNQSTILRGGIKYFAGTFSGNHAVELFADIEYFIRNSLSVSGDIMVSVAGYDGLNTFGVLPFVNLSWYFGRRDSVSSGLFEKDVSKSYSRKKKRGGLRLNRLF